MKVPPLILGSTRWRVLPSHIGILLTLCPVDAPGILQVRVFLYEYAGAPIFFTTLTPGDAHFHCNPILNSPAPF